MYSPRKPIYTDFHVHMKVACSKAPDIIGQVLEMDSCGLIVVSWDDGEVTEERPEELIILQGE